jgi:hypothetical protein
MTVLKDKFSAADSRIKSNQNHTYLAEAGQNRTGETSEEHPLVDSIQERIPEAFHMENAVIQRKVTDALTNIAEHKAAHIARYFGLDGGSPEQSTDEAAAGRAVLDAFQEAAPTSSDDGNIELIQRLHVIAGKIASATEVDPDALRALWKAPRKESPRTELLEPQELEKLQEAEVA